MPWENPNEFNNETPVYTPEPEETEDSVEETVEEKSEPVKPDKPAKPARRTKKKSRVDRRTLLEVSKKAIELKEADEAALSYLALELGSKNEDPADLAVEAVTTSEDGILADVYSFYGQEAQDIYMELFGKETDELRETWNGFKKLGLVDGRSAPSKRNEVGKEIVEAVELIDEETAEAIKRAIDLK